MEDVKKTVEGLTSHKVDVVQWRNEVEGLRQSYHLNGQEMQQVWMASLGLDWHRVRGNWHNPQGNLRPQRGKFPAPTYPFQVINMDFIELNQCEGKKFCLIIDAFSKWIELFPTKHPDALTVAKALYKDIIPRYGIPERVYSDNGSHFVNQIVAKIGTMFHIDLKNYCAYHPSSAGLVERMNGTIKNRLKKCIEETKRPWTQCLDLVKLYINITSTSGLTPYETLLGRAYRLPQFKNQWETDDEATLADYMRKILEKQQTERD